MSRLITAAGTVVVSERNGQPCVLTVHRPAYNDWTLPKGKVKTDEYLAATAVRETLEETGVHVRLGQPAGILRYKVGGGKKEVHYWVATIVDEHKHKADNEIDDVVWMPVTKALKKLTYSDERALLKKALNVVDTTPFVIVRHGKAMERKNWTARDQLRPMKARGRRQSKELIPLFAAYDIREVTSSSSTRCMKTVQPYARFLGVEVEGWNALSEEQAKDHPKGVKRITTQLFQRAVEGTSVVVCGHRPVLPLMFKAIGIEPRPMQVGTSCIIHVDAEGIIHAVEWHKSRH